MVNGMGTSRGWGYKTAVQGDQKVCTPFCTPTWRWQSPDFSVCLRTRFANFPKEKGRPVDETGRPWTLYWSV